MHSAIPDSHWQLTPFQWEHLKHLFPSPEKRGKGKPRASMKSILNTVLFVHYTRTKWEAIPQGKEWGKKTTANRWMKIWKESDLFEKILSQIKKIAPDAPEHPLNQYWDNQINTN